MAVQPQKFRMNQNQNKGLNTPKPFGLGKIFKFSLALVIVVLIVAFLAFKVNDLTKNWDVVSFSLTKPELVRSLKENYASKSAELEKSFLNREKTAEQKLIEQLTEELKSKE